MADMYAVSGDTLTGIADAIRSKTGSDEMMTVAAMAAAIEGISGGTLRSGTHIPTETPSSTTQTIDVGTSDYSHFLMVVNPFMPSELTPTRMIKAIFVDFNSENCVWIVRSTGATSEALQVQAETLDINSNFTRTGTEISIKSRGSSTDGRFVPYYVYDWFVW